MSEVSFTHLQVKTRGTMLAGRVWNEGDLIPLDGSTLAPVHPVVLEAAEAGDHPLLAAGNLDGEGEFVPIAHGRKKATDATSGKGGAKSGSRRSSG